MKQRMSITDVARHANVSIATVSNVINGKGRVSPGTVEHVRRVIAELNYSPSTSARSLKQMKAHLIGVVVPFRPGGNLQDNPFYWNLVAGIESGARDRKFHVILTGIDEERESFSFVRDRHLDGLIVVGTHQSTSVIERILNLGVPTVFMDSYLDDPTLYEVLLDDYQGGFVGAHYLLQNGHMDIAILSGEVSLSPVLKNRLEGAKQAYHEQNVSLNRMHVLEFPVSMNGGYKAAETLIDCGVTAVFCFSDVSGLGLIKGLRERGVEVPEHMSLIGFDDLYFSPYSVPAITTIQQDIVQKGKEAVRLLIDQIDEHRIPSTRKVVLPIRLIERESVQKREKK